MPKVTVNDIQMYYQVKGEGFPLVMIMGMGANLEWWDPRLILELSKNFKTVMFDNRGAGRTDISDKEYTIRLLADDTAGLMEALKISKAHVDGGSMGGMIAQELAINYPEKVEKLVLCSTSCGGAKSIPMSQEVWGMITRAHAGGLPAEKVARLTASNCFTKEYIEENPDRTELAIQQMLKIPISQEAHQRQARAVANFDAYDRLPRIKSRTLVLHGKRDIIVPPENGAILAKAIPNAKLIYFEKSAHALVEEMSEVIRSITEFLL